jgi:hypothetical protein
MARRAAVLVVALMLAPLATAYAQTAPVAPAAPGAPATPPAAATPGNPSNPADVVNNPHPTMPWFGQATPYGQFVRWLWQPPRAVSVGGRIVQEPGFWVAETTSGYYYPQHWALAQEPTGELTWRAVAPLFWPR